MVERWSKEKAWKWWNEHDWLVGCNYVPSKTPVLSIWKDDNREEILPSVRHELELMKSIGYNTVRMSISGGFNTWYYDKEQFLNTMDFVLSLLNEYGITMMPVLFGDCLPFGRPEVVKVW
ncbi:MAG: hypothetical protein J5850_02880, partial [Clostridia bacterium]|nr:hypothetical protein [Clostridia bacterium]